MANLVAGDFVRVTIEGTDRTDFVVDYSRYSSLCELGQSFTLTLSHDFPVSLSPYDTFVISEWYDGDLGLVLRGYSITIDQDFDGNFVIQGQDKSVLLFDYFIPTQIKSQGESVDFWMQYYADQVGLTIEFRSSSAFVEVAPGTQMGMMTAGDGILTMERLAAYFTRYDSSSDKLIAFRLGSSEPVITIDDVTEGRRMQGTEKTRNVVKVYGGWRFSFDPTDPPEQLYSEARTDIPELLVDKTVVVVSPGLQKQTFLNIVADRILNTVNSIDDVHLYSLPKFVPDVEVGQVAYLNIDHSPHIVYAGERKITSIEATFDDSGAQTVIGIGEKCPRVSVQFPTPPVYATTTDDGVAVSWNAGNSFIPSNTGLTGSGLMGENIGVNSYGQQMVLTAAGIFRRPSTAFSWTFVDDTSTLPDPVNDPSDAPSGVAATDLSLIRIVDEPTNRNVFHFMANGTSASGGLARSWIYTTKNFGNSWKSTQLYVPAPSGSQDHPFAPFGISYDVYGHDLFGGIDNNVFALITSSVDIFTEKDPKEVYFAAHTSIPSNVGWAGLYDGEGNPLYNTETYSFTSGDLVSRSRVFSLPENRDVAYWIMYSVHNPSTERAHYVAALRTKDGGDTWTVIVDEVLWYSGDFSGPDGDAPFDYPGHIYVDHASTDEDFNCVLTAVTHDDGESAIFRGFFINDNSVTEVTSTSNITHSVAIIGFTGEGVFNNSYNNASSHSTRTTGTNYGFMSLYGSRAVLNEEQTEIIAMDYNLVVVRYNMTTQTMGTAVDIAFQKVDDASFVSLARGGVFAADGSTPFCFYNWRTGAFPVYDVTYQYTRGSSIIRTEGPSDQKWIPYGIPYATGTNRAIAFDTEVPDSRTFYAGGTAVINTALVSNSTLKEHQGELSKNIWYMTTTFILRKHINNCLSTETFWSDFHIGIKAIDFAWKEFVA